MPAWIKGHWECLKAGQSHPIAPKVLNDCATGEKGATAIFVAVVMLVLIGMASLAIDIGYVAVTKNELQNAADASALAAARQLGVIYKNMSIESQQTYDFDPSNPTYTTDYDQILSAAKDVVNGGVNTAGGNTLTIQNVDITINAWKGTPFSNNAWEEDPPKLIAPTAVKVNVDTTIGFFFARIFGVNNMSIGVDSTAALTNTNLPTSGHGTLMAIGLSNDFFEGEGMGDYCGISIDFSSSTNCAVTFSEVNTDVKFGDTLTSTGAIDDSSVDFPSDERITIVVFKNPGGTYTCSDVNESLEVAGFAEINVKGGTKEGTVYCTFYEGRGFGSDFPLKGAIPALVQ